MTREIKFRVWDGKEMIYDWFAIEHTTEDTYEPFLRRVTAREVMQYTGLKDKNGVEIYEGDIVKRGEEISTVIFENGAFIIGWHNGSSTMVRPKLIQKGCLIIGNIYQNSDLLK